MLKSPQKVELKDNFLGQFHNKILANYLLMKNLYSIVISNEKTDIIIIEPPGFNPNIYANTRPIKKKITPNITEIITVDL